MKTGLQFLALLFSATLLAGCAAAAPTPAAEPDASAPAPSVIAEGRLLPARSETLTFPAQGRIAEILVEKGDRVVEGQVLVRLGDRQQPQAALAAAGLELTSARQALEALERTANLTHATAWQSLLDVQKTRAEAEREWERLDLDAIDRDIENAQATVEDRREDLKEAQVEFDKYRNLDEANTSRSNAENRLEQAREDLNEANRRLDEVRHRRDRPRADLNAALAAEAEARRAFEDSRTGPDKDLAELARARLANAEAQHAAALEALDRYDLKAPFAGTVLDLPVEVKQAIGPQTVVVVLADLSRWTVDTTDLTELEVVRINVGDAVTLVADALPHETVNGTVTEIGGAPKLQGGDVIYTVRLTPAEFDARWRWGMTFEVTFAEADS
jgi:multidrug efflux pump subunit AcrA (membrane-fusion protein)